ncbi:MAG: trypsin-like serine protease [Bdellovibrionota bacterium]
MKDKVILVLLVLCSCTQASLKLNEDIADVPDADFKEVDVRMSIEEARQAIEKAALICSPGSCPDGVGLLAAVGQTNHEDDSQKYYEMDTCTVTFVKLPASPADQLYALTAGHCIPKRLRAEASVCAADVAIKVVKGATVTCESVEFVSAPEEDPNTAYYDIALLKVKSDVPIATYEISQKPLNDPHKPYQIKMFSADPSRLESGKSRLRETECWYLQNSYLVPESVKGTDPFMITRDCSLMRGNSGAPLMDGGTVVGVQSNFVRYKDNVIPEGAVTVASNLYCFNAQKKSLRCEGTQPLKFADEVGDFLMPSYLNLLRRKSVNTLDVGTQKALKLLLGDSKLFESYKDLEGFSKVLRFHDVKAFGGNYLHFPFPSCYNPRSLSTELSKGIDLTGSNVIVYGLKLTHRNRIPENRLKLSLFYSIIQPDLELQYLGSGKFRIKTSVIPEGNTDIDLPPCR